MPQPRSQRAKRGDNLRDVVTASAWNALMDMLDERLRSQQGANVGTSDTIRRDCMVEVRNDTGTDLDEWQVVGLGAVTTPPSELELEFIERHVLIAELPSSTHTSKFAVLQEAIPDGEIGRALVCGITIARVDVDDIEDERASVKSGVHRFESGASGPCRILYVEQDGDNQLALVLITGEPVGDGVAFEIDTITDSPGFTGQPPARCLILARDNPKTKSPGEDENGKIEVHDLTGCFFDESTADLAGRKGFARYMKIEGETSPKWIVHSLCCPPE
jgi:hypothetical protein